MRARLEALAAKWEAEMYACGRDYQQEERALERCIDDLRALLSEPERVRMEPQPPRCWRNPLQLENGNWADWDDTGMQTLYAATAPTPAHRPVLVDGAWWWEVSDDAD